MKHNTEDAPDSEYASISADSEDDTDNLDDILDTAEKAVSSDDNLNNSESGIEDSVLGIVSGAVDDDSTPEKKAEEAASRNDSVPKRFQDFVVDNIHESENPNMSILKLIESGKI